MPKLIKLPGFFDSHTHGGYGFDFVDLRDFNEDKVRKYLNSLLQEGVQSVIGALVATSIEDIKRVLQNYDKLKAVDKYDVVKGLHFEGPFISKEKKGGHLEQNLITDLTKDLAKYIELMKHDAVKIVTIAPELPGAIEMIKALQHKISFSLGHSNANYEQSEHGYHAGALRITHLFNAQTGIDHRNPGLATLAFNEKIYTEIISDGKHVAEPIVKMAYNSGVNLMLVSDSLNNKGLPDGKYKSGDLKIEKRGSANYIEGTQTLAGSATPYNEIVRFFYNKVTTNIKEIESLTSKRHYASLRLQLPTKRKNYVILDKDFNVIRNVIKGEKVYEK